MEKEKTLEENNRMIAEFMGVHMNTNDTYELPQHGMIRVNGDFKTEFKDNELKYHTSWDWLMPVVERIESLGYFVMINKWTSIYTGKGEYRFEVKSVEGNSKIENTYKAICQFIENKNK